MQSGLNMEESTIANNKRSVGDIMMADEASTDYNNPKPLFKKYDFNFHELMVGKGKGKRSHREMMATSVASTVAHG